MSVAELRSSAFQIFRSAISAVDPAAAIRRYVRVHGDKLIVQDRTYDLTHVDRIIVIGTGKAGAVMAQAIESLLGDRITSGSVNVKYDHLAPVQTVSLVEAGHPIPDENGILGSRRIGELISDLSERDLVLCLISGGGSALMPLPVSGVSLSEIQETTQLLLSCGATINEINALRKHISQLKGGQLARRTAPAHIVSLILSDVIGDPLDVIASGPTSPDASTFDDCRRVVEKYGLENQLPGSVREHLKSGLSGEIEDTPGPNDPIFDRVQNVLIATNIQALDAAKVAADQSGYNTTILTSGLQGETREVAGLFPAIAAEIKASGNPINAPACVIIGGETTVAIRGNGKGGRNQEFVLAAALGLAGMDNTVVFSAGTDGTDGPTDAAGSIADGQTLARAEALGLDPLAFLNDNDSYNFFKPLGDLVMTGPTGTNVMDLRLLLVGT
ncbi:MAG: glycerate kinase [Candidatus Latescibacteria bacterium]|nr:glycerate kinase [Candidatus Latescibacterota bacterium]